MPTRNFPKLFSILVILSVLFSSLQLPVAQAQGGDGLKRQVNAASGRVSFIAPENGRSLPAAQALGLSRRPEDPGMALAKHYGHEFGLKDPERELAPMEKREKANGQKTVKYQQQHEGVPVLGGELVVNTNGDGDLYSINGEVSPDLSIDTQPGIPSEDARQTALESMAKWYEKSPEDFISTEPELWIFDESLLRPSTRPVELTWRMEITAKDGGLPVRELVLVNAEDGGISLHFNQVDEGKADSTLDKKQPSLVSPTCLIKNGTDNGSLLFRPYVQYDCNLSSYAAGIGDFNNDGKEDVALSVKDGDGFQNTLLIFLQGSNGVLAQPISYTAGKNSDYLAVGDLDHDNRDDVAVLDSFDQTISVYLQNNNNSLSNRVIYPLGTQGQSIAIGDVNNDGRDDVAVASYSSIQIFTQKIDGTLNPFITYAGANSDGNDIAIGDINNDGLNDVVNMKGGATEKTLLIYLQNNGHTLNPFYSISNCAYNCGGMGLEIDDITGDGLADIVMSVKGNASVAVFRQDQSGNLQPPTIYSSEAMPSPVEIADMNSDSKPDVVVLHSGYGSAGIYSQLNNGTLGTESLHSIPYKSWYYPQGLSIGDVNNDGLADIVVADDTGLVILYRRSPAPDTLSVESGNDQNALLQTQFPYPLKVKRMNYLGQPVAGTTVTFTAPSNGASVVFKSTGSNVATAVTDANGIAISPVLSSNNVSGVYKVIATANGLTSSAEFLLSNGLRVDTYTAWNTSSLPGTFLCNQSDPGCGPGNLHAKAAHQYAIGTFNFFSTKQARNSIDNNGMVVISSVYYCSQDPYECPYYNSFWNGEQIVYGAGYNDPLADDIVAHEYTHGVTQYESNLFYFYQSGAINESFSDLWGEYYDQTNGLGNDAAGVKWIIGEDVSNYPIPAGFTVPAFRSMSNPPALFDPDRMTSPYYYTGYQDNYGVHWNSGVNNKAVYLMVDGGYFNTRTVSALGWDKVGAIYYEANTNLLTSGADYSDLYYVLQQACTNLVGQKGITSGDCAAVKNAVDAVEMNSQPLTPYNPEAPLCNVPGTLPKIILADDFENGTANWTFNNGSYPRWQIDSERRGPFVQSGSHSLYADDMPVEISDATAQLVPVAIPANAYLHFAQAWELDSDSDGYYDGGVLEYSTNGGSSWLDAAPLMDYNGYNGSLSSQYGNPLGGRRAFVDTSHGYISTRLNLSSLAGQTVRFRWRLGLDDSSHGLGWWVDNLKIYQCNEIPSGWVGGVSVSSNRNVVAVGRPHVGAEVASYDGFPAGSLSAYVPMLFKNAYGTYNSALYVQNVHDTKNASITVKYYDSDGNLKCTKTDTISPLSSKGYWMPSETCNTGSLPPGWVGGAVITSDQPIVAVGRPHVGSEVMTYNGFTEGSLTSYIPMLFKGAYGGSYNSAFYIQNVNDSHAASITIKYYDSDGILQCTKADTINPLASKGYWVPTATCDTGSIPAGWVGGVVVTSDQPIVGVGRPHIGTQVTTYDGFTAGSSSSYVPMLFKAAFDGSYNAAFYLQNTNESGTAKITIKYYDSNGTLNCTKSDTISPLASKGYWLPSATCDTGSLPAGWVGGVVVTSDQPVVGVGRPHVGAQVTTYNGFTKGSLGSSLPMLFKAAWGTYNSAFYVQNTENSSATVTLKFYDTNGNLSCTRTDTIAPLSTLGYWVPSVSCNQ